MLQAPGGPIKAIDLARQSGLSRATISLLVRGTTKTLMSDNAYKVARALSVNPEWLVSGKGSMREQQGGELRHIRDVPSPQSGDRIAIPRFNVRGSMGTGWTVPDHVEVVETLTINISDLKKLCSFSAPGNLQVITGLGQSMSPTFADGDPLLVDSGVNKVEVDGVYVYELDGELFIKRLQRLPGKKLRVISDNRAQFDPYDLTPAQMQGMTVRAAVVLAWNARRP